MSDYGVLVTIVNLARYYWAKLLNELDLLQEGFSSCEEKVG